MKIIILCALFAPIIYLAARQKKWYLYLLFAFIGVLPEQFSVKTHDSLPLLTVTRLLIVVVMGFWLYDKWKTKKFHFPKSLIAFLAVNVIVSLVNLRFGTDDIRRIFLLIFERVLLVLMVMDMIHDREELHRCLDFAIMGCAALAVIGIVQTVFDYNIASPLHLTETVTSVKIKDRMGLVRAFGTYNAISYGCYCAFMAPMILYRLYNTKKIWHSIAFALNLVALICTFTRSAWLCLAAVLFVLLVVYRTTLVRRLLAGIAITVALCTVLCCIQPKLFHAFVETGKSSINTVLRVLPDEVLTKLHLEEIETADDADDAAEDEQSLGFEIDDEFGANRDDPTYSRTAQWTAIEYIIKEKQLLFGYGYNALLRGCIHFYYDRWAATWTPTTYLDVGLVALIAESGLIGTLSHLGFLIFLLVCAFPKRGRKKDFNFSSLVLFVIPLYLLLNFMSSFLFHHIVWLFIGLVYAHRKLERGTEPAIDGNQEQPAAHPMVSIYVPTFNHENYITQALDSILMQQTEYSYEVFVGEDCSTDNTRRVLQDWEVKHPGVFNILYRAENMHRSNPNNARDLKSRCKGKYIICLEGDDFWTDPLKLQTQVAFLESHPEYYAVAHNCTVVGEDSQPNGETYPECKDAEYTLRHFASDILPGQYTTLLSRNYLTDENVDRGLLSVSGGAGDRRIYFTILCHGKIHCIQKSMSAYRHVTSGGSSFSATRKYSYDRLEADFRNYLEFSYKIGHPEAIACAEMLYLRNIRHAKRTGHIDSARAKKDAARIRNKLRARMLLLKRDINCRILHKTLHI